MADAGLDKSIQDLKDDVYLVKPRQVFNKYYDKAKGVYDKYVGGGEKPSKSEPFVFDGPKEKAEEEKQNTKQTTPKKAVKKVGTSPYTERKIQASPKKSTPKKVASTKR